MSLKPIIKSAREALDRKDYPYALQLCTDALAFEPENYWLLIFRAVSLLNTGESELALKEYEKASRIQNDNPVAFQGIINLYESKEIEFDERYHSALQNLASLLFSQNECEKHLILMKKRLKLHKESKDLTECLKILDWFSSSEAHQFYPPHLLPDRNLILKEQFNLINTLETAQIAKDIDTGRMRLASSDPIARLSDRCHVQNYSKKLTEVIMKLSEIEPEIYFDLLVKRLTRIVLSDFCVNSDLRSEYSTKLKEFLIESPIKSTTLDYIKYNIELHGPDPDEPNTCEPPGPRNALNSLKLAGESGDFELVLKAFDDFESICKRWDRAFNDVDGYSEYLLSARKLKLKALISCNYPEDALQFLTAHFKDEDLLDDLLFEPVLSLLEAFGGLSRAVGLIELKLTEIDPEHPGIILRLVENLIDAKRVLEAKEYLSAITDSYPPETLDSETVARLSFNKGRCYWDAESSPDKAKILAHFLEAAKLNDKESKYFTWIGKVYWCFDRDSTVGKKCFLKALTLDPSNYPAALFLAEIVLEQSIISEMKGIVELLEPFTKQSCHSRDRRLFYYFGVAQFHLKSYLDSSVALQSALKSPAVNDIKDENCLQWLGEAYFKSNRLGSAAKAFTRLNLHGKVGLATVHLNLNNPIEAVNILDSICDENEKILLDKSDALISLTRHYLIQGRFLSAMKSVLRALQVLKGISCPAAYRMAADCFVLAHTYQEILGFPLEKFIKYQNTQLNVNPGLKEIQDSLETIKHQDDQLVLGSIGIEFALAAISEAFAHEEKPVLPVYWLQLAASLSKIDSLHEFAISAAESAYKHESCTGTIKSQAHHLLALIYSKSSSHSRNHRLTQHHFISALKCKETCLIWTDLGRFYVIAGDWDLAREAFQKALSTDPEDLTAAFELAKCGGSLEGQFAARQVAQRAFTCQPVSFSKQFALILTEFDNPFKEIAGVYLYKLLRQHPMKNVSLPEIPQFPSKLDLLTFLNDKSVEFPFIWLSPVANEFDCEFLLKRPENDFNQSGWRAVVEGIIPGTNERTDAELQELALP